jgi:triphosphoribosyl-dephospho-CoA synthetase
MNGRFRAFNGRGGQKQPQVPVNKEPKKEKTIEDYFFYVGSSKQASDFETTSEFLINHMKKTFDRGNDISEALQMLELHDIKQW